MKTTTGKLYVTGRTGRQSEVTCTHDYDDWDRDYFCVSGFFGSYGPDLFAAAPDLYEALEDVLSDLDIGAHPHLHIETIRAALAKARGETQ